ncbi:MAG: hypothetical protein EP347_00985 [Alphaproteobacteria bacterium]|nr:MAG: hypothetical protein EP347_00985 [Alphaproteobacteria bacterium]
MTDHSQTKPRTGVSSELTSVKGSQEREYHIALDRVMCEIEALRGTAHPRLAFVEEWMAS